MPPHQGLTAVPVVDAQVHIWSEGTPIGAHRRVSAFTALELLDAMAEAGVDAAILHPPGWDPNGMRVADAAVHDHPGRFGILGHVPADRPESAALLPGWLGRPGMMGLRYAMVMPHEASWPFDGTLDWLWPRAEALGIPVSLQAGRFLQVFRHIAERHPALRLSIDHCGLPRHATDDAAFAALDPLLSLAGLPNVAIKATGVPAYSTHPYPFRNIHDGLHRIFDAFGPDRFFWGTDLTRMHCPYRQCVTLFTQELPWLGGDELVRVMGGGACTWFGFHPDTEAETTTRGTT